MEQNRIEKHIDLKAAPARVWKALTDYKEFGQWFGCEFEGPFVVGQTVRGKLNHQSWEQWAIDVKQMEPERLFSFTWHPYPIDPAIDYSKETPTLVEFRLEPNGSGTHLTVTESGFDKLPANRRLEAFRKNDAGWIEQLENIAKYVG
ncbi:MAG TPA: SRPBCC family protein [Anaerolineales bacterium]|nr:SRPBCC family protein [Anaerolineales bacterium]